MEEADDVLLMERFRDGDRSALEALVDRHHASLVRYFFHQSRSWETAEDLAQETWVRIIRHRAHYQPTARFQTYLFSIARNLWIDRYRSQKAAPPTFSADREVGGEEGEGVALATLLPGKEPEPSERASVHEEAGRIREALEDLPEGLRQVFELGEIQGLKYTEVGSILDIPVGTVKSRMHAAIQRLRQALAPRRGGKPAGKGPS
ncbi:MAG: sigma-70 family RNA polymerase sigma factor [Planctomycetes bacterium]|nr:sigma-70 family RNA polymerase sigma factor [Planctomycetota bacterium]